MTLEYADMKRCLWHDRYVGSLPTRYGGWYCQTRMACWNQVYRRLARGGT